MIVIGAKQNNWHQKRHEKELPECLEHLAKPYLTKVGQSLKVYQNDATFPVLCRCLQGEDPRQFENEEIEKEIEPITRGVLKRINEVCDRLREKGLDDPDTPKRVARSLKKSVLEAVNS
jgi:hypothetical protein